MTELKTASEVDASRSSRWLQAGGADAYRHDRDGWTIRTADGSRATHAEHTIAITEGGPRVLTAGRPTS